MSETAIVIAFAVAVAFCVYLIIRSLRFARSINEHTKRMDEEIKRMKEKTAEIRRCSAQIKAETELMARASQEVRARARKVGEKLDDENSDGNGELH